MPILTDKKISAVEYNGTNVPLQTLSVESEKSVTINASGVTTVTPDSGYDGIAQVNVTVPESVNSNPTLKNNGDNTYSPAFNINSGFVNTTEELVGTSIPAVTTTTFTPTKSEQIIAPANSYVPNQIKMSAIPDEYIIPSGNISIVDKTSHNVTQYATAQIDSTSSANLIASNIRKDVSILGVTGTLDKPTYLLDVGRTVNTLYTNINYDKTTLINYLKTLSYETISETYTIPFHKLITFKQASDTSQRFLMAHKIGTDPDVYYNLSIVLKSSTEEYSDEHIIFEDNDWIDYIVTLDSTYDREITIIDDSFKQYIDYIFALDGISESRPTSTSYYGIGFGNSLSQVQGETDITNTNSTNVLWSATARISEANRNKLISANIKKDVEILGVTGTLEEKLPTESVTITPTTSQQTITPTSGKTINNITVNAVTSSIDANIQAGNIKKDVSILGVTGTYGGVTPTGTLNITQNGTYDVTNYASALVELPISAYILTATAGVFTNDILKDSRLPYAFFALYESSGAFTSMSTTTLYIDASATLGATGHTACIGWDFDTNEIRFHGYVNEDATEKETTIKATYNNSTGTLTITNAIYNGTDVSSYISLIDFKLIMTGLSASLYTTDPSTENVTVSGQSLTFDGSTTVTNQDLTLASDATVSGNNITFS